MVLPTPNYSRKAGDHAGRDGRVDTGRGFCDKEITNLGRNLRPSASVIKVNKGPLRGVRNVKKPEQLLLFVAAAWSLPRPMAA